MQLHDAIKRRWSERIGQAVQTLQRWPWLDTLRTLKQRFREDRLGVTASSLTFTTTIALVPLFTVMLAIFSVFPMFARFKGELEKYFVQTLVPDTIARPVLTALTDFAAKAHELGGLGLIVLVVSAVVLMLTIDHALNGIWRVRSPRPIGQRVLLYWAAATLGPLLVGASLTLTSYAISESRGIVESLPGGVKLLLNATEFGILAVAMAGLYHYVPNTHVRFRHALAGGLFVAAAFEGAKELLAWYVSAVPTFAAVYGAFATVPILLTWIYLGWVVVLLGAVVAAYAPSLQMHVVHRPQTAGHAFALALMLLGELRRAQLRGEGGLSGIQLAQTLRTDPLQIEPVLDALIEMDWVGRLEESGDQRYVLLVDATTSAVPLIERMLIEPSAATARFWRQLGVSGLKLDQLLESPAVP